MKRPERSRYVIPAMRFKSSKECEDGMEGEEEEGGQYASEATNTQTDFFGKHSSQRRYTDIVPKQVRFQSSSYNPKNTSKGSCTDEDSSDFEEYCCDIVTMDNLRIRNEITQDDSNDQWKEGVKEKPTQIDLGIEIGRYGVKTEISNKLLMQQKDSSDLKYFSNQGLNSESNEQRCDRNLFYKYDDSGLSDIEAVIDSYTKKGSVLTSTPNSHIVDERILDAAKYDPLGESVMESTLFAESDMQTTMNTNRNNCDYNFEIFHDSPSVKKQPKDYSEVFGHNYIAPPVPPPAYIFRLPPIHRLPTPVSSIYKLSVQHPASLQPSVPRPASLQPSVPRPASLQPSVPRPVYLQPYGPRAASIRTSGLLAVSPQPSGLHAISPQPCVPRAVSPQPCLPRAVSPQPCLPRAVSPQPSVFHPVSIQPPVSRSVFPQNMPQLFTQLRHPRLLLPPSLQLYLDSSQLQLYKSSNIQHIRRHLSSSCIQPVYDPLSPEPPYMTSSIQPPCSPEVRAISLHSLQDMINPPNLAMYKQDGQFYIPPPVPPPRIRDKSLDLQY